MGGNKIPEAFREACSYSRYRGITCPDRYQLSGCYFSQIVHGCLICTDNECDIDSDGNICLVTPQLDVLHIGTIPMVEGKYGGLVTLRDSQIRFDAQENLRIRYTEYLDNSHYHSERQEIIIDTHLDSARREEIEINRILAEIASLHWGWRNRTGECRVYISAEYTKGRIRIESCVYQNRHHEPSERYTQWVFKKDGIWVPEPLADGQNPVIMTGLRSEHQFTTFPPGKPTASAVG